MLSNIKFLFLYLACIGLFFGCEDANPPDEIVLPKAAIGNVTKIEGDENNNFEFRVLLVGENPDGMSVDYETLAGTATAEEDYIPASGTLNIPGGMKEGVIEVEVVGDAENEGDENFTVVLSNARGASITDPEGVGTIRNDDEGKLAIPATGYSTPESYDGMTLVWEDDFSGTTINKEDWTFEIGTGDNGWGNNELQYYREENASILDGNLVITAKKEAYAGSQYTSTRMVTMGKQEFIYGRIDIRAVLPEGQGIWPALWMLGANFGTVGWPACGEIDIMELVGHVPNQVHGTVHYGANFANHQFTGGSKTISGGSKFSDEFHVFSIVWEQNSIKWYVDDQLYFQTSATSISPYPFNNDFFFIFNVAVGGNWPGSPDNTTAFPQYMIVDYVRVFQKD